MPDEPPNLGDGETIDVVDDRLDQSPGDPVPPEERYKEEDWLYQQYKVLNRSIRDLADRCDVWPKTIQRWLDKHDIETRSPGRSSKPRGDTPWRDEGWLRREYLDRGKSVYAIADEQGCDEKTIRNWLAEHEIPTRSYSDRHPKSRENPRYRDEAWLREQYIDRHRTGDEIAADCGVGDSTIYRWLDRHGIETRSMAEARQLTEARPVRVTDDGGPESDPEDQVQQAVGKRTYKGPRSGLDLSQQYLAEREGVTLESPYRDEAWLREYHERLGTVAAVADLCNVDPNTIRYWMRKHDIELPNSRDERTYSMSDIFEAIRSYATAEGEPVSIDDYTAWARGRESVPSRGTIQNRMDETDQSWRAIVRAAGVEPPGDIIWTKERTAQAIARAMNDTEGDLTTTGYQTWQASRDAPVWATVIKRFDSWADAKRAARSYR